MNQESLSIVLIDDNPNDRLLVARELRKVFSNLLLVQITDMDGFQKIFEEFSYDLVITDYQLHWSDGLAILRAIKACSPGCPVIMFTGTGSEEIAVEAMKAGLDDYILKSPRHFSRLPGAVRVLIERVRHQKSITETEIRAQTLVEGVPVGLYRTRPDGKILDVIEAMVHMLGFRSRSELLNSSAIDFYTDPEDRRNCTEILGREGQLQHYEFQLRRQDEDIIWVEDNCRAVCGPEGEVLYYEGSLEDITERRRSEEALRRSEDRFRSLVESIDDIVWEIDEYRVFSYVSPKIYPVLGYKPEEIIGCPAEELDLGDEVEELFRIYSHHPDEIRGNRLFEGRFIHKEDQRRIILETTVTPIEDEKGSLSGFRGVCRDITERRRAEHELRQSNSELQAIFQALPDLYFRTDRGGRILDFKGMKDDGRFALPSDFLGLPITQVLPAPVNATLQDAIEQVSATGELTILEYSLPDHDQSREYEARLLPLLDDQVVIFSREITERRQAESALQRREEILSAVSQTAELLLKTADWRDCIQDVLSQLGQATNVSRVYLFQILTSEDTRIASQLYEWCAEGIEPQIDNPELTAARMDTGPLTRLNETLETGQVFWGIIRDFESEEREFFQREQIQSILVVPIQANGGCWGFMGFDNCLTEQQWSAAEVDALVGASNILGAAIQRKHFEAALESAQVQFRDLVERALVGIYVMDADLRFQYANPRLEEITGYRADELTAGMTIADLLADSGGDPSPVEPDQTGNLRAVARARRRDGSLIDIEIQGSQAFGGTQPAMIGTILDITERKQREREMQVVLQISAALRSLSTRAEILPVLLDQVLQHLKLKGAFLVLRDPQSGDLVIEQGRGAWKESTGVHLMPEERLSLRAMETGEPYINPDISRDPDLIRPELLHGVVSVVCIPLISQRHALGALWVGCSTPFSEPEIRLLNAIGGIAANAIHRTTLHEQTELRLHRLTALRAIDLAISASLDLRVTLSILLGQITVQLGIHAAGVMLLNPFTQVLEYAALRGFHTNGLQNRRQRLGEGYAGEVAATRKPAIIHNYKSERDSSGREPLEGEGFQSYLAVPLIAKGQVKGVLEIFHRDPLFPDPEWMDFLQAIASQAAIAVDNAELFERLQRSNLELTLAYDATIEGWARAMGLRGFDSGESIENLIDTTLGLARRVGIQEADMIHIRRGVLLHDIGRMAIPDRILFKPGPLDEAEWKVMRMHPQYAYEMLAPIPYLRPALEIPYCHHEHWDGSGYPRGLKGKQIPLPARVFSVVDVWDALQSERPHRPAWSREQALQHLREIAGSQLDPDIVAIFLKSLEE